MSFHHETLYDFFFAVWAECGERVLWSPPQLWSDVAYLLHTPGHETQDIIVPHDMSILTWSRELFHNGADTVTMYVLAYLVSVAVTYRLPVVPYPTSAAFLEACTTWSISSDKAYYYYVDTPPTMEEIVNTNTDLEPIRAYIEEWIAQGQDRERIHRLVTFLQYTSENWRQAFQRTHPMSGINPIQIVLSVPQNTTDRLTLEQVENARRTLDRVFLSMRQNCEVSQDLNEIRQYDIPPQVRQFLQHNTEIGRILLEPWSAMEQGSIERAETMNLLVNWAQACRGKSKAEIRAVLFFLGTYHTLSLAASSIRDEIETIHTPTQRRYKKKLAFVIVIVFFTFVSLQWVQFSPWILLSLYFNNVNTEQPVTRFILPERDPTLAVFEIVRGLSRLYRLDWVIPMGETGFEIWNRVVTYWDLDFLLKTCKNLDATNPLDITELSDKDLLEQLHKTLEQMNEMKEKKQRAPPFPALYSQSTLPERMLQFNGLPHDGDGSASGGSARPNKGTGGGGGRVDDDVHSGPSHDGDDSAAGVSARHIEGMDDDVHSGLSHDGVSARPNKGTDVGDGRADDDVHSGLHHDGGSAGEGGEQGNAVVLIGISKDGRRSEVTTWTSRFRNYMLDFFESFGYLPQMAATALVSLGYVAVVVVKGNRQWRVQLQQ